MSIRKLVVLGLVSYALTKFFGSPDQRPRQITNRSRTPSAGVRQAGPGAMRNPPRDWDATDERLDESFPASDPPGRY